MSTKAQGPDQAIGWVMALACFFINFIMSGLARTVGVLYVALIELYGVSREAATTPFSIRVCVRNMTGPLIGLLGMKYGIRAVTASGGFVAALGSILCCFAPDVLWITVFWGIIHGIGLGLSTVIHMMIIGQYFDKYKASALGLGYSGDCFGTFAFPTIIELLLTTYDIQGTFLILGGILLHVIPLGLLLKKPPWIKDNKKAGNFSQNIASQRIPNSDIPTGYPDKEREIVQHSVGYKNEVFSNLDENLSPFKGAVTYCQESQNAAFEIGDDPPIYQDVIKTDNRICNFRQEVSSRSGSTRSHLSEIKHEDIDRHDSLSPVLEKMTTLEKNNLSEVISTSEEMQLPKDEPEKESDSQDDQYCENMKTTRTASFMSQMAHEIVHKMRAASFASQVAQEGFLNNLQQEQNEAENEETYPSFVHKEQYILKNGQISPIIDVKIFGQNDATEQELPVNVGNIGDNDSKDPTLSIHIKNSKGPSVLMTLVRTNVKPIFVLISVTMAAYGFLFIGVLTIIIDYAADHGISQERGKFLIIGFSAADLIGRLSFGFIIDRKLVKMKNYAGMNMLFMGTLAAVIPLNTSFNFMIVCMCLYGLAQGGTAIMFPILVSFYMEKNEESVAMGCLSFYGGLLMLALAPMIGYFRDNTGSYNGVFHILGGLVALVGIAWQFEPLILKFQEKQLEKRLRNCKI